MAQKQYSDEDIVRLLGEIELGLASGSDVVTACRTADQSDATYCTCVNGLVAWASLMGFDGCVKIVKSQVYVISNNPRCYSVSN